MKRTLTRAEMLELWRNYRTGEPLRLDCTVTRTDGTDFDAVLAAETSAAAAAWISGAPGAGPAPFCAIAEPVAGVPEAGDYSRSN